jgi:uncharacterized membrane protein YgcG
LSRLAGLRIGALLWRRRWLTAVVLTIVTSIGLAIVVPHRIPSAPAAERPPRDEAVVDAAGLLSPTFVRTKSGLMLDNAELAQMLVVVTPRVPPGDLEEYTVDTASAWQIGSEHLDNGLVLFIFPYVRKARLEVGYGLEGALPDGRLRDVLDQTLVPAFSRGDYEPGLGALIDEVLDLLRRDRSAADTENSSWTGTVRSAFARFPRMIRLTWRSFEEAELKGRLGVALFASVATWIFALGFYFAFRFVLAILELIRGPSAGESATRLEHTGSRVLHLFLGTAGTAACFVLTVALLLQFESFLPRKGHFGGGGVTVTWFTH